MTVLLDLRQNITMKCYEKQPGIVSESNEIHVSAQSATFGILSHIRIMFFCYGGALFQ